MLFNVRMELYKVQKQSRDENAQEDYPITARQWKTTAKRLSTCTFDACIISTTKYRVYVFIPA